MQVYYSSRMPDVLIHHNLQVKPPGTNYFFVKILDTAYATGVKNATVANGFKEW